MLRSGTVGSGLLGWGGVVSGRVWCGEDALVGRGTLGFG